MHVLEKNRDIRADLANLRNHRLPLFGDDSFQNLPQIMLFSHIHN